MNELFESGGNSHYHDWRNKRFNFIQKHYDNKFGMGFFNQKKMLEYGCGRGHLGRMFEEVGCEVTYLDGRPEHISWIKSNYPKSDVILMDCEKYCMKEYYDIILHSGLLYHIQPKYVKTHLEKVLESNFKYLILETCVLDSDDENAFLETPQRGYDQAISEKGSLFPNIAIEKILKDNNISFQRFNNPELDSTIHVYSWTPKNTGLYGGRSLWLCEK